MAITWIKAKYTEPKTRGRYKSAGGDSRKRRNRRKTGKTQKLARQRVMVLTADGKTRWGWR